MKKINFGTETDTRLKKYLEHYCLAIPEDEKGRFLRGDAVQLLVEYQKMLTAEEDRRMKVVFHRTGDQTQGEYVFVGLNGRGYQIPYDTEVVLPESVVRVCDDAKVTTFKQSDAPSYGRIDRKSFEHSTAPYTFIEWMDEEGMMLPEDEEDKKSAK